MWESMQRKSLVKITMNEPGEQNEPVVPNALYNLTTGYLISWEKVEARLRSYPYEASMVDHNGFTILHHALARRDRAPLGVVHGLLAAYPLAASLRTVTGQTPLSIACWRRVSAETLEAVANADPSATGIPDKRGTYPLEALWESYRNSFPQTDGIWRKMCVLIRVSYHASPGSSHHILHAAAGTPWCCPLPVLRIAVNRCSTELHEKDDLGRLPLHVAATSTLSPPIELLEPEIGNLSTIKKNKGETDIDILIRAYPESACLPDDSGQLPLLLAIRSGRMWNFGLSSLVTAFPEALQTREPRTGLFPFQYASTYSTTSTEVVFNLLKAAPHLIFSEADQQ